MDHDEGYNLVTQKKSKKQVNPQPQLIHRKKKEVTKKTTTTEREEKIKEEDCKGLAS